MIDLRLIFNSSANQPSLTSCGSGLCAICVPHESEPFLFRRYRRATDCRDATGLYSLASEIARLVPEPPMPATNSIPMTQAS